MSDSTGVKLLLTVGIGILMVPGLVIEPGPISELVGIGAVLSIWGIDWDGGSA